MKANEARSLSVFVTFVLIAGFSACSMKEDPKPEEGANPQSQNEKPMSRAGQHDAQGTPNIHQPDVTQNQGGSKTNSAQSEVIALIERLAAQKNKPPNSPPSLPLLGRKSYLLSDQGELQEVDLAYTPATDDDLAKLATIPSIETLQLTGTKITDEGIKHLVALPKLNVLTLYATPITDESIDHLMAMPALQFVGLNTTRVTKSGMEKLKAAKPALKVQ